MLYEISGMTCGLFEKNSKGEQEPWQILKYIHEKIFKICSINPQIKIFVNDT